jgi:hypothetical protein
MIMEQHWLNRVLALNIVGRTRSDLDLGLFIVRIFFIYGARGSGVG